MEKIRRILHCDLNSFYASVELLKHPELKEVPVAVSGSPDSRHGIILAKNEPAKKFRVQTAETVWQAKRKCPELVLLPPHHEEYKKYSKIINGIYNEFTDKVEPFSIDESWLDVTDTMHLFGGNGTAVGDLVRRTVKERTGLTISVGVSYNKVFAKLGSDYKKPDAVTVITLQNYQKILWPLPVTALIYVGQSAFKKLRGYGIRTIGDLACFDRSILKYDLGKTGEMLHDYANGIDDSPVRLAKEARTVKSVGNGNTFSKDLKNMKEVRQGLYPLCETVARRLKGYGLKCRGVQVTIKDEAFHSISRQVMLREATHLTKVLFEAAVSMVQKEWHFSKNIRMLTVTGIHLEDARDRSTEQLSFFSEEKSERREKDEKLEAMMATLQGKFGAEVITRGSVLPENEEDRHSLTDHSYL